MHNITLRAGDLVGEGGAVQLQQGQIRRAAERHLELWGDAVPHGDGRLPLPGRRQPRHVLQNRQGAALAPADKFPLSPSSLSVDVAIPKQIHATRCLPGCWSVHASSSFSDHAAEALCHSACTLHLCSATPAISRAHQLVS